MSRAQTLLVFAAIAAAAVVGTMGFAFLFQNQVDVYFDNGLAGPVTVSVDGESFPLPNGAPRKRSLGPGVHEVVVSQEAGEIERARIEIVKKSLMAALLERDFYVYNVAQAHIYRRAHYTYAVEESRRGYSEQILAFQQFFLQPRAHFIFEPAPNQITMDGETATRDEFVVASDLDYNGLANMRLNEGNLAEAGKAVDKALALDACHVNAYRNRILLLVAEGGNPKAADVARAFRESCSKTGIDAHRAYQDTMIDLGRRDAIELEYRERREREPSPENDYLLGRLGSGEEALALYRAALEKDPAFARARLALAWDLMGLERYEEAVHEIEIALDAGALLSEAVYLYGFAVTGAGRSAEANTRLGPLAARLPSEFAVWQARWITSLARQDWTGAERLLLEYDRMAGITAWSQRIQLLQLKGELDRAREELERVRARPEVAPAAEPVRFQLLYEKARYDEAARCLGETPGGGSDLHRLYAAAGLRMSGREEAESQLRGLEEELLAQGSDEARFYRTAALALRGRASEGEILGAAREAGFLMLPHAYFLIGAYHQAEGNSSAARTHFRKSVSTAVSFDFPYVAARSLSGI